MEKLIQTPLPKNLLTLRVFLCFFVAHCGQFQLQIATVFQLNKILSYPFPLIIDYFRISHSALCFPPKFDISFCFQMP